MSSKVKNLISKTLAFVITTGTAGLAAWLVGLNPAVAGAVAAVVIFKS